LGASMWQGFWHASLYTVWIYGIIYAAHYLG
jgi:ABC-type sulfate transport system permease subunit